MSDVDVRKKAADLYRLAIDGGTSQHERDAANKQLLALIGKYGLFKGQPVNVTVDMFKQVLKQALSGELVDIIVGQAEKYATGIERVIAAGKRITDARGPVPKPTKRKRTYR